MQTCVDLGVGKARLTGRRGSGAHDNVTSDHMCVSAMSVSVL